METLQLTMIVVISVFRFCASDIYPCPLQAEENAANFVVECRGISHNDQVSWQRQKDSTRTDVGSCDPLPNSCISKIPGLMTLSRPSDDVSTLTITSVDRALYGGANFTCTSFAMQSAKTNSSFCQMDVIYSAEVQNCSVLPVRSGDRWSVQASCFITKVFSSLDRYTCHLLEEHASKDFSLTNSSYSPSLDNSSVPYGSGRCDVTYDLNPQPTNYTVVVYPGASRVPAGNISPVLPNVSPTMTCSPHEGQYVAENENIYCKCSTPDLGHPEGQLMGYRGDTLLSDGNLGDDILTLPTQTLGRPDNGTVFRCVVLSDWATGDDQRLETNLTVSVAYGPEKVELSDPGVFDLHPSGLSTMTLTCNVTSASPSVTFIWQGACAGHTASTCTFAPSISDNGKTVTCAAHNKFTNITMAASRILELNYPPQNSPVIAGYDGSLMQPGQSLLLSCDVTGGLPLVDSVTFTCQGQGQEAQGQSSSLNLTVEASNHGDQCVCSARWKIAEWYSLFAVTTLLVSQPTEIMSMTVNNTSGVLTVNESKGDNLSVSCFALGVPSPALTLLWHGGKQLIALGGGQLSGESITTLSTLVPARCDSSATYTCVAGSADQQLRANVTLNVLCSPHFLLGAQPTETPGINLSLSPSILAFTLESNPAPDLFSFLSLGKEESPIIAHTEADANAFTVECSNTEMTSRHDCVITVGRVAEVKDGFYSLVIENSLGRELLKFRVFRKNETTDSREILDCKASNQADYVVAVVVLGVLLFLALACIVFRVLFVRSRRKTTRTTDTSGGHVDLRNISLSDSSGYSPATAPATDTSGGHVGIRNISFPDSSGYSSATAPENLQSGSHPARHGQSNKGYITPYDDSAAADYEPVGDFRTPGEEFPSAEGIPDEANAGLYVDMNKKANNSIEDNMYVPMDAGSSSERKDEASYVNVVKQASPGVSDSET